MTTSVVRIANNEIDAGCIKSSDQVRQPDLESSQVNYYARYFGDPVSRLFWKGNRLQLGLLPGYGRNFSELLDSAQLEDLFVQRLIARPSPAPIELGFEKVYELDCRSRITYWHEWSPNMLRLAALRIIESLRKLTERGLTLRNPHPWNLLYDGREFVYINPGSVVPFDGETFARGYEKIARFFVRPLLLIENGFAHMARRLASDARDGVIAQDVAHLDCKWAEWPVDGADKAAVPFLTEAAARIEAFECKIGGQHWFNYFSNDCDFSAGTSWTRKQEVLEAILDDASIESVLDLGANTGHYARVAARRGREVIAADFDPAVVDRAFAESRAENGTIYPVVLDFSHPTQGQGIEGSWFPPATERFAADLVLCFALSHHMVFGRYRLDFEQIARGVRSFARKWALVEFIERNNKIVPSSFRPEADEWYDIRYLEAGLRRHFPVVECLPPAKDGRRLLVCGPARSGL
jgi:SAM-dependent methyltransferase